MPVPVVELFEFERTLPDSSLYYSCCSGWSFQSSNRHLPWSFRMFAVGDGQMMILKYLCSVDKFMLPYPGDLMLSCLVLEVNH
jgi:hypothetical protein